MRVRGCFVLETARVKALGWLKKKERRLKMTKRDFHHFQVHHISNVSEEYLCFCRVGATPKSRFKCL